MSKYYVLYNPLSGNGTGREKVDGLKKYYDEKDLVLIDYTKASSLSEIVAQMSENDVLILCGGDGTINHFVNEMNSVIFKGDVLYYAAGTGNDFLNDLEKKPDSEPFSLLPYIQNLPTVTIDGKTTKFINGVGYGIDGYCCEVADKLRGTSDKPINYSAIAIKGLLFYFKPANAIVTVDGQTYEYKKVWLAPVMNGRFYGGGMIPTPAQDRLNSNHTLSVLVWHGSGKIATLANFPNIFKGEHIKKSNMCIIHTGHHITVEFDAPTAAQIDGDTVLNVRKIDAHSAE